jgi:hypothetical protein
MVQLDLLDRVQGGNMNKPITTKTHGMLDYLSVPTLLILPRALHWGEKMTNLLTGAALGVLGYSMMTRYELGIFKVLPMKGHLAMDMVSGAMLAAAPFLLLDEQERSGTMIGMLLGIGAFEIAAANLTQPQPSLATEGLSMTDRLTIGIDKVKESIGVGQ